MEKYEGGSSKPILVKEVNRQEYILIDGHHRLEAVKRLKRQKIDVEVVGDNVDVYSLAVSENLKHGIPLTKDEEERILIKLHEEGNTQEEIGYVFGVKQNTISDWMKSLGISASDNTKLPITNELISGKQGVEIAKLYNISKGRVSQIWGDFKNEVINNYNNGISKNEIIEEQLGKKINLTLEALNKIIKEDNNKIITGDCLEEIPKLKDNSIDCVIIDPPYGMDYQSNYRKEKHERMMNDDEKVFKLLDKSLNQVKTKMKKDSHIYIFTSWKVIEKVKPIIEKHFNIKNCLIWNKNNWSAGDLKNNYAEKYEMIIFATQGKRPLYSEVRPVNVLNYNRENTDAHPTRKPVELLKELLRNSTKNKELVLDFFAGSGATLEAARQEGRRWLGIEINFINDKRIVKVIK